MSEYPGVPGSDYINASYVKGASGSNAYIACQGPLPHTVNDFWRLVVETEVQVIVMACNEQEGGKHKCERYWSEETDTECQYGKYFVRLLKSREICPDFLGKIDIFLLFKVPSPFSYSWTRLLEAEDIGRVQGNKNGGGTLVICSILLFPVSFPSVFER